MNYDIAIVGAGPAGLSFAKALAGQDLQIAMIEKSSEETLAHPAYDGREIALTHFSKDFLSKFDMWNLLPADAISLIRHAKVVNGRSDYALHFNPHSGGQDILGWMVSNHDLRRVAYESVKHQSNLHILTSREVKEMHIDGSVRRLHLSDGTQVCASLVVAADSRFSTMRRMAGISAEMLDFGRTCIVCKMHITGQHHDTAYEYFHFDRTLAILPLSPQEVSAVITLGAHESQSILSMTPEELAADIERRTQGQLGQMSLTTELYSYPLVATYAQQFVANRLAIIGDAAVGMHPVTAHGFNLGLQSVHTLANIIRRARKSGLDLASHTLLTEYDQTHRRQSRLIYKGTNLLVKLYTDTRSPAKFVRHWLLRIGNQLSPAKSLIVNQLTRSCDTLRQ